MTPEIIVINLDRSPDRLAFMAKQFERLGLSFTRLKATDASDIDDAMFERLGRRWQRPMTRGEVACLMSHSRAWRLCRDSGRATAILEDDVILSDRLAAFLEEVSGLGYPYVNMETRGTAKFVSRRRAADCAASQAAIHRLFVDRGGSAAYVIQPDAAAKLLDRLNDHAAPADAYLNSEAGFFRFQTDPGLASPVYGTPGETRLLGRTFATTIDYSRRALAPKVARLVGVPLFRLRRVNGYLSLSLRRLRNLRSGVRRQIPLCPTILHNAANRNS